MAADATRVVSAQSTGLRWRELRATNYEDPVDHGAYDAVERIGVITVHEEFAAADTTNEATANWGGALRVYAYDRLTLLLNTPVVAGLTAVHVAAQVSYSDGGSAEWFDLFADEASDGILVRKVWDQGTPVIGGIAWSTPTEGRYMRFKVWTDGTRTNTRAVLYARRIMDAS